MSRYKYLFLFLLLSPGLVFASSTRQRTGSWWNAYFIKDNNKWIYSLQLETRFIFDNNILRRVLLRPSIGYKINKNLSLQVGYTSEPSLTSEKKFFYNHNIFEGITMQVLPKRLNLRLRAEQRWSQLGTGMAHRLRARLQLTLPTHFKKINFIISDEVFFNANHPDWVSNKKLSENRAILGFGYNLSKKTKFRISYMNQINFNSSSNTINHIIIFSLFYKIQ